MRRLIPFLMVSLPFARVAFADSLSTQGSPSPSATFNIEQNFVQTGQQITDFRFLKDGRIVLIAKTGQVLVRPAAGGALVTAGTIPVDDSSEKGLLGIAIDPQFSATNRIFLYYSATGAQASDAARHRVVSRTLSPSNVLSTTETVLVQKLRGPANHDGGALDIGPDGNLYIGVGDTGCNSGELAEPPYTPSNYYGTCLSEHATNNGAGNGKILRVALDGSIPSDNPLVGATNVTKCGAGCGTAISGTGTGMPRTDLFAWGFRNPFRLWVDPLTGNVWVGDVGEVSYEEVTIAQKGRHHGWPWREGFYGWAKTKCRDVVGTNQNGMSIAADCVDPIYSCRHDDSGLQQSVDPDCTSITGGQIVDDCTWPAAFRGKYFFGDNVNGQIWTLTPNSARNGITGSRQPFATITSGVPVSIRAGNDGALYIAKLPGGLTRISPKIPASCTAPDGGVVDASVIDASLADVRPPDGSGIDGATIDGATVDARLIDGAGGDGSVIDGGVNDGPATDGSAASDGSQEDGQAAGDGATGPDAAQQRVESSIGCGCNVASKPATNCATTLFFSALALTTAVVIYRRRRRQ